MTTVLALGDSFSCGEGVGVRVPRELTWPALLAATLPAGRVVHLARPGARVRDVRQTQLPLTAGRAGAIATVLVGLNDVARVGFAPDRVRDDLLATVDHLLRERRIVLIGRLHDPTTLLAVPELVRRRGRRRTAQVNMAVDEAATRPGVLVLDPAAVTALADRTGMAVDRLHPSATGHAVIAAAAGAVLRRAGWTVASPPVPPPPSPHSVAQQARWLVVHAVPYLAGHLPDLGRPALAALVRRA